MLKLDTCWIVLLCLFLSLFASSGDAAAITSLHSYPEIEAAWNQGDLDGAIHLLQEKKQRDIENKDVDELLRAMSLQKEKMDAWLKKSGHFLEQKKIEKARHALALAPTISSNYPPYKTLLARINALEQAMLFPPQVLFDGSGLGDTFVSYNNDGKLEQLGAFTEKGLEVNVPEGHGWGRVGLASKNALAVFSAHPDQTVRLDFEFQREKTRGYTIELDAIDPNAADLKIVFRQNGTDRPILQLLSNNVVQQQAFVAPDSIKKLTLVVSPDQYCYAETDDGFLVQTAFYPKEPAKGGYILRVYALASTYKASTSMALTSITMAQRPFTPSSNLSHLDDSEQDIVLFDGSHFNKQWIPFPYTKHSDMFFHTARIKQGELVAEVDADEKWKKRVGLGSPEPLVWMDKLDRRGTAITVTVQFSPGQTSGFVLTAGEINSFWQEPTGNMMEIVWKRLGKTGKPGLEVWINRTKVFDEVTSMTEASAISLVLTEGQFRLQGAGMPDRAFAWPSLLTDRGVHLWVTSLRSNKETPVGMAIQKILLHRTIGKENTGATSELSPLPITKLLTPETQQDFGCFSGKEGGKPCAWQNDTLAIKVSPGEKEPKGVRAPEEMIVLDKRRITHGSKEIVFHFDPLQTNEFDLSFGSHHLILRKENDGMYSFSFDTIRRLVTESWLKEQWNGQLTLTFSGTAMHAQLDESVGILQLTKPTTTMAVQIATLSPPKSGNEQKGFVIKTITGQWLPPEGGDAAQRWNYVDDDDFDPDAFLRELKRALP
ncbi:MAG: hypothetical protein AB7E77_02300 [Desulfobulbus sp.]